MTDKAKTEQDVLREEIDSLDWFRSQVVSALSEGFSKIESSAGVQKTADRILALITPAADADRVRIAVELINAEINAPLTGPTHGAWDRGRIAGLKEALAALKSSEVEKMSAQRRDLIKRLAKAECGSRELDKAIFEATSPPAEYAEWSPRLRGYQYTTSIDAALSWAEWVLPGQEWRFGSGTRDTTLPWARIGRWAEPDAVGATPALAICGAILIALNRAEIEATRSPSATLAALRSTVAKERGAG